MSNEEKNIKDYNSYLASFIFLNLIIYIFVSLGKVFISEILSEPYIIPLIESGILFLLFSLLAFILSGLLSSDNKARLVYWKIKNPYPSFKSFTELADEDNRINKSILKDKYGELPTEPKDQHDLWYRIFKKDQFDPMIFDSHRTALIFRDLTSISFLLLILSPIVIFITIFVLKVQFNYLWLYVVWLVFQYLILSKSAKDRGKRFVCNVLANVSV